MHYRIYIILFITSFLVGCMPGPNDGGTSSLKQLQQLTMNSNGSGVAVSINQIRLIEIQDAATSIGARSGLAWRTKQINNNLTRRTQELDATYNFYGLLLNRDILPPVLEEGRQTLNLADPNTIRLSQKIYRIIKQARFVTAPPTWRGYLWMNYPQPDIPDKSLLPKTKQERMVWNHYVTIGWNQGIEQADNIFEVNLHRINRDYNGMILYHKLYAQNMVSAPFVAKTDLGITGNGVHLRVGDQVLRIVALPQLNINGQTWKPAIVPGEETMRPREKIADSNAMTYINSK